MIGVKAHKNGFLINFIYSCDIESKFDLISWDGLFGTDTSSILFKTSSTIMAFVSEQSRQVGSLIT